MDVEKFSRLLTKYQKLSESLELEMEVQAVVIHFSPGPVSKDYHKEIEEESERILNRSRFEQVILQPYFPFTELRIQRRMNVRRSQ